MSKNYKTLTISKSAANKTWLIIDCKDQILGRVASRIAMLLLGKHHPLYSPGSLFTGYRVIAINVSKIQLTGKKIKTKIYRKHTGYMGGLREYKLNNFKDITPEFMLQHAVKGMLPGIALKKMLLKNLRIFNDSIHTLESVNPIEVEVCK